MKLATTTLPRADAARRPDEAAVPGGALARVSGLAVANPAASFTQAEVLDLLGLRGDPFAEGIFARSGVERRHLEISPDQLATRLQHRTPRTEQQLFDLAVAAVDRLNTDLDEIGTLITATYYSLGGPTLGHRLLEHYDMDPATDKYHLVGVGCASAVPLFKLAGQALRDHPERKALVVTAESITGFITPLSPGDEKTKVVGSALFGDGCAAALLSADGDSDGPALISPKVHQVYGTLGQVHFKLAADDSYMQIGRELPVIAAERLKDLVNRFLRPHGLDRAAVDHWLVHPGGRGIIEGVQRALSLSDEQVSVSYDVLASFGNMGTPCSFYVLKQTQEEKRPRPGEVGLMVTIGPGVTVGLMLLRW
jgi:predicted naringenin-chalcone synthase